MKITVIGAGNMGGSLIQGLLNNGYTPAQICACDPSQEKLNALKNSLQIHTTTNNLEGIKEAKVIIFAIKPKFVADVASELSAVIQTHQPLIITIAAGIRIARLEEWLSHPAAIVRAMPNTPALIGCAATALYANAQTNKAQRTLAESILRAVGVIVWLQDEQLLDTVTALSGSGPAYFFLFMEALEEAATQLGLPSDTAHLLTLQTALGAIRMAIESGSSLSDLRHQVTSPQGTTEKAISVLESSKMRELVKKALLAAKLRSEELGK